MHCKDSSCKPVSVSGNSAVRIEIDAHSGFCFGVVRAIEIAETELSRHGKLYSLGDIVHNTEEVTRLTNKGLRVITHQQIESIPRQRLLIRAHGEPPSTYSKALQNNIRIVDATCSVVLQLQKKVRQGYIDMQEKGGQVMIFGKKGHAEVEGLVGQTDDTARVISDNSEIESVDIQKPLRLYAQTTQSLEQYKTLAQSIRQRYEANGRAHPDFIWYDTICRQVSNREESLKSFAKAHHVILFVSDAKSSNGTALYQIVRCVNARSYFVSRIGQLDAKWFTDCGSIGICGATSTPLWLMREMKNRLHEMINTAYSNIE